MAGMTRKKDLEFHYYVCLGFGNIFGLCSVSLETSKLYRLPKDLKYKVRVLEVLDFHRLPELLYVSGNFVAVCKKGLLYNSHRKI